MFDVLLTLASAIDLVTPDLANHHQKVAYMSYRIAEGMNLSMEEKQALVIEGLLHDIGAFSTNERLSVLEEEGNILNSHAFRGAKLIEECPTFVPYAKAVKYHHVPWNYGAGAQFQGEEIPLASHILHLADSVSSMIRPKTDVLSQVPDILAFVMKQKDKTFCPEVAQCVLDMCDKEYIWLELNYKTPLTCMPDISAFSIRDLGLEEITYISKMFSHIVDFRSHSTATHSVAVGKIAERLGRMAGFSENECEMLKIAGHLHDLGKLAIDDSVLEKPSNLNEHEYNIIRSHTFYTYQLLRNIAGFETINKWASYHHEKLNGRGYPFHLEGKDIPLGSRIMAVADIFTAITENRSYRKGMSKEKVVSILTAMVEDGSISDYVVSLLLKDYDMFMKMREESYDHASRHFDHFFEESDQDTEMDTFLSEFDM